MQPQMRLQARALRFTGTVRDLRRWLRVLKGSGRLADLLARRN
ncbi:MAG TPA: hypothetical protein VNM16_14080 [Bacillota bacterium]|nr:hypothetical protein [Bacillota bacterium]